MRTSRAILAAATILGGFVASAMYVGTEGGAVLPSGGSGLDRGGSGGAFAGIEWGESAAVEISGGARRGGAYAAADAVWHWYGFALYDRYFGFSAWDPFFIGGFAAEFGDDGDYGPEVGVGLYYHLSDRWSLRATARGELGLDGGCATAFSIGAGIEFRY